MTIDQFIIQFKVAKDKDEFLKKHIIQKYVSYAEKIAYCQRIIDGSSYIPVKDSEEKIFNINTPLRFVLFSMTLLNLYTDIDIDFNNTLECFDKLNEVGAVNALLSNLPEAEYNEFSTILSMVADDFMENNRSFIGYVDTKIKAAEILLNTLSSTFSEESIKKLLSEIPTEA